VRAAYSSAIGPANDLDFAPADIKLFGVGLAMFDARHSSRKLCWLCIVLPWSFRHRRRDGFCYRSKSGNDLWKDVIMQGPTRRLESSPRLFAPRATRWCCPRGLGLLQAPSIERFGDWMLFVIGRPHDDGFDNDIVYFGADQRGRAILLSVCGRYVFARPQQRGGLPAVHFCGLPQLATAKVAPISTVHCDEGWHLHQPATLGQGGFHESGMWPFLRQT
jgi:hypothetical protein